jgi:hypothetical protein
MTAQTKHRTTPHLRALTFRCPACVCTRPRRYHTLLVTGAGASRIRTACAEHGLHPSAALSHARSDRGGCKGRRAVGDTCGLHPWASLRRPDSDCNGCKCRIATGNDRNRRSSRVAESPGLSDRQGRGAVEHRPARLVVVELPRKLSEYSRHLRTPVNVRLHRQSHQVSHPDIVRMVLWPLDSADDAKLTAPAPDLAVGNGTCLAHTDIVPPGRQFGDHYAAVGVIRVGRTHGPRVIASIKSEWRVVQLNAVAQQKREAHSAADTCASIPTAPPVALRR